jgi:hypothetical protein
MECGTEFSVEKYAELMDQVLEEELGNIPCDRL